MTTPTAEFTALEHQQAPVRAKLSAAWTSLMFLYIYVDHFSLYKPGVIDDILAGVVSEFDISQTWATGALTLMALSILMVILSVTLPARANRVTNLVVASVYVPVSVFSGVGESWTYFFGLAVVLEVIVLALALRWSWTWPRAAAPASSGPSPR
ncbi:MAG: DUF6326 family protein [Nitriliruptoraceae bacterium]